MRKLKKYYLTSVSRKGTLLLFNIAADPCVSVLSRLSFLSNRAGLLLWIRLLNLVTLPSNTIAFISEESLFKYSLLLLVIICCCNCCLNSCNPRCVGLSFPVLLLSLVNKDFLRALISRRNAFLQ